MPYTQSEQHRRDAVRAVQRFLSMQCPLTVEENRALARSYRRAYASLVR